MTSSELSTSADDGEVFVEGSTPRDRLRVSINHMEHEQQRLAALEAARDRCRQQQWGARTALADAAEALERTRKDEGMRVAYAYLNQERASDPIGAAKRKIDAAQDELDRLEGIDAALSDEIKRSERECTALRGILYQRMADLVVDSMEYEVLLAQHKEAWTRLRSIKQVMRVISAGLHGTLPNRYADLVNLVEPLEPRLGYEMQSTMIESWEMALTELESNADVDLPLFG